MEYDEKDNEESEIPLEAPGVFMRGRQAVSLGEANNQDVEYMSREGYEKLKQELETLKTRDRLTIAERLEYAKSLGDLSENAEFDAAKEEQMLNEMRINELEQLLRRAKVVDKHVSSSFVGIGSTIVVRRKDESQEETYIMVGSSEEADPIVGRISHESPLGRAFLGCKKGQAVTVTTPRGASKYVIVEVS